MRVKEWGRMPGWWIDEGVIKKIRWGNDDLGTSGSKLAAMKIYMTIIALGDVEEVNNFNFLQCASTSVEYVARLTYNRISSVSGLSRSLISGGILVLKKLGLVTVRGDGKSRAYSLERFSELRGWSKIPVKALWDGSQGSIKPFSYFTMRSKIELYAMKMYFYLAKIRDNKEKFSTASFETISSRTGIPERDIPKTYTFLAGSGFLSYINKSYETIGPNSYVLAGGYTLAGRK